MKCAAGFIMMKNEAIAKHEAALQSIRIERSKRAIEMADTTIEKALTEKALQRQPLETYLEVAVGTDEVGKYFEEIVWSTPYSDGLRSGSSLFHVEKIDYNTFVEYLEKHCIAFFDSGSIYKYAISTRKNIHYYNKLRIFIPAQQERPCEI